MPTQKADLSRLSITQLRELTGRHATTIRKRLKGLKPLAKDGRTIWYAPREALPLLFGIGGLDLTPWEPKLGAALLVCTTELATREAIDRLLAALAGSAT